MIAGLCRALPSVPGKTRTTKLVLALTFFSSLPGQHERDARQYDEDDDQVIPVLVFDHLSHERQGFPVDLRTRIHAPCV